MTLLCLLFRYILYANLSLMRTPIFGFTATIIYVNIVIGTINDNILQNLKYVLATYLKKLIMVKLLIA